ncbi:MAG: dihydrolipoyllysine-residue acetyltransferase [Pseudomonadales bacterium]|nr:dihydrolipoyllysine-residue acetyltransferase [Pseudomonadales bacterium]
MIKQILVPDVGEAEDVEVIEVLVLVGDSINADDSLVVLESDKASMEIPSPMAGVVKSIAVKEGDTVDEGSLILELDTATTLQTKSNSGDSIVNSAEIEAPKPAAVSVSVEKIVDDATASTNLEVNTQETVEQAAQESVEIDIVVPDVGEADEVVLTEYLVAAGDQVNIDDSLVVLESDKASMEIPSPNAGTVAALKVEVGLEVKPGDALLSLIVEPADAVAAEPSAALDTEPSAALDTEPSAALNSEPLAALVKEPAATQQEQTTSAEQITAANVYAGPAVRKMARQFGVPLGLIKGTGRKGRILKEDVQSYVKKQLAKPAADSATAGSGIPPIPGIDFSKFGETELSPMSRIKQATAKNLHRSWLNVPHVTQFDEADITELEIFRKTQNTQLAKSGQKLTPLAFMVAACVSALKIFPQFNASLEADYKNLILKKYYNIGVAVETPEGLVVPVIKNADKKGIVELAAETATLAQQARDKKLPMDSMLGASFTISSLGGIGGTKFTPIVNAPEVAILGVSKSKMSPVWNGEVFEPRMMLPLSLSYDHRAIDGAEAARFTNYLSAVLADLRRILL